MNEQRTGRDCTISLLALLALTCFTIAGNDGLSQTSFKGMELNSWRPAAGVWHFSLLLGTDRTRTIEDITDPGMTIIGVDDLKKKLAALPKGEDVFWLNYAKEPVPGEIIMDLRNYSKTIGINLRMGNR